MATGIGMTVATGIGTTGTQAIMVGPIVADARSSPLCSLN
jgi:hypothetical protein